MTFKSVCVFVIQGLLAWASPTTSVADRAPEDVGSLEPVLVEGVAEFSGIVPAYGSATVLGNFGCSPFMPTDPTVLGNDEAFFRTDECALPDSNAQSFLAEGVRNMDYIYNTDLEPFSEPSPYLENNYMDDLSKKVIIGSIIADSITAGNEAEIEAKLTEINSFVDSELAKTGSIVNAVTKNAAASVIDALINSDLSEMESQIALMETIVESELAKTEKLVESVIENKTTMIELELAAKELLADLGIAESETQMSKQAEIHAKLAEIDSIIESELARIDSFVESELAKVDSFIESELAKVDSFVESKLAITQSLIDKELIKMNSHVDTKLAKIEKLIKSILQAESTTLVSMQGVADSSGVVPASGKVFENTGYSPILDNTEVAPGTPDFTRNDGIPESIVIEERTFSGVVPAAGHVQILGNFGCPPLFPSNPPVVGNAKPFMQNDICSLYDKAFSLLARGNNAPNMYDTDDVPSQVNMLPSVNLHHKNIGVNGDGYNDAAVEGKLNVNGKTRATGKTTVFSEFGCPPLFPSNPPVVGNAKPFMQNDVCSLYDKAYSLLARGNNAPNMYNTDGVPSQVNMLPSVNLQRKDIGVNGDGYNDAAVEGSLNVNGRTRATGKTTVFAEFGCDPLLPTQMTSDGRKYIWLSKRPKNSVIPPPPSRTSHQIHKRPSFPIMPTYPADFPEKIIMDSTKNYERFIENDAVNNQDGDMFFKGVIPAFGSVSVTGHCV